MNSYNLLLIGNNNIQDKILNDFIEKTLGKGCKTIKCEALLTQKFPDKTIFLIDTSHLGEADSEHLQSILINMSNSMSIVLFNTNETYLKRQILKWPNCCGVFSTGTHIDDFVLGMQKILKGEYWLPRAMMAELLQHYQVNFKVHLTPAHTPITSRERDVLALLPTCKSNIDIANSLFVSEHTVKSHLYKVFKKIEVKNRLQAIAWVKENL